MTSKEDRRKKIEERGKSGKKKEMTKKKGKHFSSFKCLLKISQAL
jgi:hypothetical protein